MLDHLLSMPQKYTYIITDTRHGGKTYETSSTNSDDALRKVVRKHRLIEHQCKIKRSHK